LLRTLVSCRRTQINDKYERLLEAVENSRIIFTETDSAGIPANTIRIGKDYGIFFNESAYETTAERRVALAHEKAHCDTGAMCSVHTPLQTYEICEAKAWKRTILDALPFDEMSGEFEKCVYADGLDIYEIADRLDVTPEFAKMAIEHYHERGERW